MSVLDHIGLAYQQKVSVLALQIALHRNLGPTWSCPLEEFLAICNTVEKEKVNQQ